MIGAAIGLVTADGAKITVGVQVDEAWIRWLPGTLPYAAYVTLNNRGDHAATLVSVSSLAFADVSLHQNRSEAGVNKMVPVATISLAARTRLSFAATGYHLMLTHPAKPVSPGDQVPITLGFADGGKLTVMFKVRAPDAGH